MTRKPRRPKPINVATKRTPTALEQLYLWWAKTAPADRLEFLRSIKVG